MEFRLFPVFLLLCVQPWSGNTHQNLTCLNDYVSSIACIWDSTGTPFNTVCKLHGAYGRRRSGSLCDLKPLDGQNPMLQGCKLIFNRTFHEHGVVSIKVICENTTEPALQMKEYRPRLHLKLTPPGTPTITHDNISWTFGSPFPEKFEYYIFQLQYAKAGQRWEEVKPTPLQRMWCDVSGRLEKGEHYQVRVRVGPITPDEYYQGEWSLWSPVTSWRSEAGESPGERTLEVVIGCTALAFLLLAVVAVVIVPKHTSWVYKVICQAVPDPSKFFDPMVSVHGGNFQKWLCPMFSPESFLILQHSEDISPVEVTNKDTDTLFRKENVTALEQWDSSGQSSSFSNIGYFCSRYPYENETCPVHFSYQSKGDSAEKRTEAIEVVDSGPIETCSSYECLQKLGDNKEEPIHPDSGFGMASDDQETDEEGENEDRLRQKTCSSHPAAIPALLSPFSFPASFRHDGLGFPHLPLPLGTALANKLGSNLASRQIEEALCNSCFGTIEPSSGEYMPVRDTQNGSPDENT